jgi:hypothetical protein
MGWAYGERRDAYKVLVGKLEGKRPLGRHRYRCECTVKIDLQNVGLGGGGGMNWIELIQDRDRWWALVNTVMSLWVLYSAGNYMSS